MLPSNREEDRACYVEIFALEVVCVSFLRFSVSHK